MAVSAIFRVPEIGAAGTSFAKSIDARGGVNSCFSSLHVNRKVNIRAKFSRMDGLKTTDEEATTTASLPLRTLTNDDPFGFGKVMEDGFVYRQSFRIRSYEIGPDRAVSIETIMNLLQETALNHAKSEGFMSTALSPEMSKRNLVWVVTKMEILVDRYPTWGDVVQLDSWVAASGKNGLRRDWFVRDRHTGDLLMRASSSCVMMNKETRRLAKIDDQLRAEIEGYLADFPPVLYGDKRKLPKLNDTTADYVRTDITPRWSDFDVIMHVNNVKYIDLILESVPFQILEGYDLAGLILEYRRECRKGCVLESLTSVLHNDANGDLTKFGNVECQHLVRLKSGEDIVKGITEWRPKSTNKFET